MKWNEIHNGCQKKAFSWWGQLNTGSHCPERLCCHHPGMFSRCSWIKPWATWSAVTADLAVSRMLDWRLPMGPFSLHFSMICHSMCIYGTSGILNSVDAPSGHSISTGCLPHTHSSIMDSSEESCEGKFPCCVFQESGTMDYTHISKLSWPFWGVTAASDLCVQAGGDLPTSTFSTLHPSPEESGLHVSEPSWREMWRG